ncbi:SET domain-containing protein-lysine N-methyltransferase [Dokdonella sp.]|uniref:SET domain-containing protein n=1 Tax=Dokdonella sp. TaxID=2291710 RepID=UPI0026362337|nr:SET domain-containing protein-lysine N-methyltransferase [Dokdonella sp.]
MTRRIAARRSPIHGNGVFALVDIPKGTELIEYRGKRLTHAQADRLYANTSETGHTFLFTLNDRYVIDANFEGNIARWINHSCAPNCRAVLEEDAGGDARKDRVLIEATRALRAGEELTYDYGIVLEERLTSKLKQIWACRCGAPKCVGTMLKPKRKPVAKTAAKKKVARKA